MKRISQENRKAENQKEPGKRYKNINERATIN